MRKMFFTKGIVQQWNRLPREAVDSPLELFETQLDKTIADLIHSLCQFHFEEEARVDDFQRSCPTGI